MRGRTGSVDTTRGGRHRARLSVNGKRPTLGGFDTKEEAERELAAALDVLDTEAPDANTVLLGDWLDKHLERRELSREYRDADGDRGWFDRHVKPDEIASLPLKALRPHDLDD